MFKNKITSIVLATAIIVSALFIPTLLPTKAATIVSKNNNAELSGYTYSEAPQYVNDDTISTGKNLLYKNNSGVITYYKANDNTEYTATAKQNQQLIPLTDGVLTDATHNDVQIPDTDKYCFTWDLTGGKTDSVATIDEVWVIQRSGDANFSFRVSFYEIRVADTVAGLNSDDALVASVQNVSSSEHYNKIKFKTAVSGRYIQLRSTKMSGDYRARYSQFVAFGTTEPSVPRAISYQYSEDKTVFTEEIAKSSKNILKGNTTGKIVCTNVESGAEISLSTKEQNKLNKVVDGSFALQNSSGTTIYNQDIGSGEAVKKTYDITWDLLNNNPAWANAKITDIWIRWTNSDAGMSFRVSEFKVYAANTIDDLYKESSEVTTVKGLNSSVSSNRIVFDTPITARYLRIACTNMTGDYKYWQVRINEVAVLGSYTPAIAYTEKDGELVISGYNGSRDVTSISIPQKFEGKSVVAIEEDAFSALNKLEYVYIPKSVKSIADTALPDGVTKISGAWGSEAQKYANKKGIWFETDSYSLSQDHKGELLSDETNVLEGAGVVLSKCQDGVYSAVSTDTANVNDNDPTTVFQDESKLPFYDYENGTGRDLYVDFVFDSGGVNSIQKILYLGHKTPEARTQKYQIYVSDTTDSDDLFESKNFLLEFNNTESSVRQIFTLDETISARLVGLRVLQPAPLPAPVGREYYYNLRVLEFAVYGSKTEDVVNDFSADNLFKLPDDLGNNLITKSTNVNTKYNTANGTVNALFVGHLNTIDGNLNTTGYAPKSIITENSGNSFEFIYSLGSKADISAILLANDGQKEYRTRYVEIFAANSKKSLFNAKNLVESYDNTNGYRRLVWRFKSTISGSYVGIRITNPAKTDENNSYPRIAEVGVYGKYKDSAYKPGESNTTLIYTDFKNKDLEKVSKNKALNADELPTVVKFNDKKTTVFTNIGKVTDQDLYPADDEGRLCTIKSGGTMTTHDGSMYLDVIWNFGKYHEVQKFLQYGSSNDDLSRPYHTGWYQIYVGDNIYDVTNPENMVYEYRYDKQGKSNGQIVDLRGDDGNYPIGKCVAFRLLNGISSEDDSVKHGYSRIAELLFWGKEANRRTVPTNLSKNVLINGYLRDGETEKELSQDVFNKETYSALYDGLYEDDGTLISTEKELTVKTNSKKFVLSFNLCSNMEIDKIFLHLKDDVGYKVYASERLNDLESEDSLVFNHKKGGKTVKSFGKNPLKARYVKIVFDKAKVVTIKEWGIIGGDDQARNYQNLLRLEEAAITEYSLSNGGEATSIVPISTDAWKRLKDEDNASAVSAEGGVQSAGDTLNLMIDFCGLKSIDRVKINYPPKAKNYWPYVVNVYVGNDYEELTVRTKPDYTIKGMPKDANGSSTSAKEAFHELNIKPQFAKYMRVEFEKANKDCDYFDEMVVSVGEVRVYGIAVDGTAYGDAEGRIFSYTDKKYNVTAEVLALNESDIYEDIVSAKITKIKLNNDQKVSLMGDMLKPVGEYYYKVSFFNDKGKEIVDLGSRNVQVKFKCPGDPFDYSAYYVPTSSEAYILASAEYGKSKNQQICAVTDEFTIITNNYCFGLAKYAEKDDPYFDTLVTDDKSPEEEYFNDPPLFEEEFGDPLFEEETVENQPQIEVEPNQEVVNEPKPQKEEKPNYLWLIILFGIGAVAVILIGGWLIIKKLKTKN